MRKIVFAISVLTAAVTFGGAASARRLAENLHQAIDGDDGEEVRAELRKLIERVDFIPV